MSTLTESASSPTTPARPGPGSNVAFEPGPPLLRGWFHLVGFFLSFPAAGLLLAAASAPRARVAVVAYSVGMAALFGVSAAYHRGGWTGSARRRVRRLDHGIIFVMIAGSYTPLCLLVLHGTMAIVVLVTVWAGAVGGLILAVTGVAEKPAVGMVCYIGLGWLIVIALPQLLDGLSDSELVLLVAGGVVYTVGGVFLATRWPDPFPRVFGYHEVWHAMVVAAAVCHFLTIVSVVRRSPA
ncbi:MAG: PAQR family membrane homeostasis protein TrhA [Acidimicrobiales bacterium]